MNCCKELRSFFQVQTLILIVLVFATPLQPAWAQETQSQQTISPNVYHKFGVIFKIDKYKFVKIPADPRVKNPQAAFLLSVMSVNGVELKEPKMMSYRFSTSIASHKDQFDKLVNEKAPIFAYESLYTTGRASVPLSVRKEMENWILVAAPGFRVINTLEIVDAKGLDLNSMKTKLDRLNQEIRDDAKRAQAPIENSTED